ncbi:hypothetical protein HJC23_005868 [Cyclotella cryptica]|uniref:BPL/LPL catalytic domain-containing protein n=1 Tax=Cyclotella cryptica TaxID=29204 RepID=A0ABD3QZB9_9STRA|eukprot:CCRYP_000406-RA/>CCRYP_000406-RA protein AED:0.03 eAED:0.03 QI:162/-1/1/1/-1/1/1/214/389
MSPFHISLTCKIPALRHLSKSLTTAASNFTKQPQMAWLDLRGLGLSALERLSIEELLLRHDPLNRCWGIVGCHEPVENRLLNVAASSSGEGRVTRDGGDEYGHGNSESNNSCTIILGIGGKMDRLVNIPAARRDGVLVLRRFSGGGTVVVDHNCLWTTFIGRNDVPMTRSREHVKPFPREIMQWSADTIFHPVFCGMNVEIIESDKKDSAKRRAGRQTLVFHGKSCGISGGVGETLFLPSIQVDGLQTGETDVDKTMLPTFQLRENDYVLGEKKMGGNAQSIVSSGFLHHTSFLWDYDHNNMEYLTLPEKRPNYRGNRSHNDFLIKLKDRYGVGSTKNSFFDHVKNATSQTFELEDVLLSDVLNIANEKFGSLQHWFDSKCRTKIVKLE